MEQVLISAHLAPSRPNNKSPQASCSPGHLMRRAAEQLAFLASLSVPTSAAARVSRFYQLRPRPGPKPRTEEYRRTGGGAGLERVGAVGPRPARLRRLASSPPRPLRSGSSLPRGPRPAGGAAVEPRRVSSSGGQSGAGSRRLPQLAGQGRHAAPAKRQRSRQPPPSTVPRTKVKLF